MRQKKKIKKKRDLYKIERSFLISSFDIYFPTYTTYYKSPLLCSRFFFVCRGRKTRVYGCLCGHMLYHTIMYIVLAHTTTNRTSV